MPPTLGGNGAASLEDTAYAAANATFRERFSAAHVDFAHSLRWYALEKREEKELQTQIGLIVDTLESLDALLAEAPVSDEHRPLFEEQRQSGRQIIEVYTAENRFDEAAVRRYANQMVNRLLPILPTEISGAYLITHVNPGDRPTPV